MKKKTLILGLVITSLFFTTLITIGHSPSSMDLSYDFATQTLYVIVYHTVADPSTHYIFKIDVYVNEIQQPGGGNYNSQTLTDIQEDSFAITAADGDVIRVVAMCNLGGSIMEEITIVEPAVSEFNNNILFLPLTFLLVIGFSLAIRKKSL